MPQRPQNEDELQKLSAIGVIRASRFVRKYARLHEPISIKTICEIHKEIFRDAWPEIAGRYREENLSIADSKHNPPHHSRVRELMEQADQDFVSRLKKIENADGVISSDRTSDAILQQKIDDIVMVAVWIHHKITHIHPFREGNGRTARLFANLILERYGLVGISIKIEKENKNRYLRALAQIDSMDDYEPLKEIVYEGLIERYDGVNLKYYSFNKK